jgi:putative hydrolase of the HAD superfamily
MLKAVFFDGAGTLFEPRDPVGVSYAEIARAYGIDVDPDVVNAAFRRVFHEARALAFGPGRDDAELRALEYRWWRDLVASSFAGLRTFTDFDAYFARLFEFFADASNWRLDPSAASTLRRLRDRGFRLGIISNFDYRLYRILEQLGLREFFDAITISSEAGFAKPDAQIFRIAVAKFGVEAREALHVGDSVQLDLAGAVGAGLAAVLLDKSIARLRIDGRNARVSSLEAVVDVVQQLQFP